MKNQILLFIFFLALSFCYSPIAHAQDIIDPLTSQARDFADQTAKQMMKKICPNTGRDAYGVVNRWEYDPRKDEFEIKMDVYWLGATCGLCSTESFSVSGVLKVRANGTQANFSRTGETESVRRADSNNKWLKGGAITLAALAVLSQSGQ